MKTSRTLKGPKRQAPVTGFDPNLLPVNGRVRPAAPFVYVHYAGAWEFHNVQGWLPQLSKLVAMPGVNGVDERLDLSRAIQGAVSKGGTYINPKDRRLLMDGEEEDEEDDPEAAFSDFSAGFDDEAGALLDEAPRLSLR